MPRVGFSVGALWLVGACSLSPRDGQFRCDDGVTCPSSQVCVDRVCRDPALVRDAMPAGDAGPPPDASMDGGRPRDAGADDAGPPETDAGGFDAGFDAGRPESCEADPETGAAVDEDGDGAIDEGGCGFHFGRPHLVTRIHAGFADHFGMSLNGDATRAYLGVWRAGDPIVFVERGDVGVAFEGPPVPLTSTAAEGRRYGVVSVTADELEMVAQTEADGLRYFTRAGPEDAFAEDDAIRASLPVGFHPWLSSDGLELFVAQDGTSGTRSILRAARSSRGLGFGPATPLALSAMRVDSPRLSPDGRMLLYLDLDNGLMRAERPARGEPFGEPARVDGPLGAASFATYHSTSRELWFVRLPGGLDAPSVHALHRVQVCRDSECPEEPTIDCPTGSISEDGFHCYTVALDTSATWGAHLAACRGAEGELASVATAAELAVVTSTLDGAWIGLNRGIVSPDPAQFAWSSGEPLLFAPSGGSPEAPTGSNCVRALGSTWEAFPCGTLLRGVCEHEALPRWLP